MRKLALPFCALLVALAVYVPAGLTSAHADTATWCGNGLETIDVTYEETGNYKKQTAQVFDSYPLGPPYHNVDADLKAYHVLLNGYCWRSYYVSDWTEDGTPANMEAQVRTWVCGRGPYNFDQGLVWTSNRRSVPQVGWGGVETTITRNVQMWDGTIVGMTFARYGNSDTGTLCGRQADNYFTQAGTETWDRVLQSNPSNPYWYVNY